jgi:RHS repeat-associated protein
VRFERDALGRVVQEYQGAHQVDYAYDARGQRTGLQSSLGATFAWQHDPMGHLRSVQAGDTWQAHLLHDARGLELQRQCSGGLLLAWQHDAAGRPTSQRVAVGHQPQRQRRYQWQGADQLAAIEDSLTGTTHYRYDALGALTGARYADGRQDVRLADAVGNLFRSPALDDRQYAPGGQLRQAGGTRYKYDEEGNLVQKTNPAGQAWRYAWDGAGQLASVTLPSGYTVMFAYDALGRRTSKRYRGRVTRWVWDGDVPLHEWTELEVGPGAGSVEDLATWLFEENSFAPAAKLTAQGAYSVVADHLGTPLELYDQRGTKTWQAQLDSYGAVRAGRGWPQDCPFRYQGQYEDVETGLYYNRFRYYDPDVGRYISQDPIRLTGGAKLYSYVHNTNSWVDELGLAGLPGVDFTGHPDLFPATGNQQNIVKIKMQGRRGLDFTQAHKEAQITRAQAKGYTWHHLHDFDPITGETTMQLVGTDTHVESFPHKGSAGQFADHFGVKYDSKEAIDVSKQQGWHSSCP